MFWWIFSVVCALFVGIGIGLLCFTDLLVKHRRYF